MVAMNVSVVDVSSNQKKLQVEIPADRVQRELDSRYQNLAKQVRIKGFRQGKVPRSVLKSYYGKSVETEVSNQFIQDTFTEALRQAKLKPLAEADVDDMSFKEDGAFIYTAIVDISPPFELQGYKGLEIMKAPIEVREEQIAAGLKTIQEQHAKLQDLEVTRPIKEGDMVVVDFIPSVDGVVFEKGKTTDYMIEVGKNSLHPQFDANLLGHEAGDSFSFSLYYPEDASNGEIAGKTVHFDVTIKQHKEKILPEVNDEFARGLGQHESLEGLKQSIKERLAREQEQRASAEIHQQIIEQLVTKVDIELSNKVVEREIDHLIGMFQHQFESQGLKIDPSRFNTPEIRSEYRIQAEKNIRWHLITRRIAELEDINLTDEDIQGIYAEIARLLKTDVRKVQSEYADSTLVEQAKDSKLQDKILQLLESEAIVKQPSEAAE
jgi:trigger factor